MAPIPPYPGARSLTNGRVYGAPPERIHIAWETTASRDEPRTVVAHYEKLLGIHATSNGKTWSFNTKRDQGGAWVSYTLEIIPAAVAKDYPGGEVPPADDELTVMLAATAMGPDREP